MHLLISCVFRDSPFAWMNLFRGVTARVHNSISGWKVNWFMEWWTIIRSEQGRNLHLSRRNWISEVIYRQYFEASTNYFMFFFFFIFTRGKQGRILYNQFGTFVFYSPRNIPLEKNSPDPGHTPTLNQIIQHVSVTSNNMRKSTLPFAPLQERDRNDGQCKEIERKRSEKYVLGVRWLWIRNARHCPPYLTAHPCHCQRRIALCLVFLLLSLNLSLPSFCFAHLSRIANAHCNVEHGEQQPLRPTGSS